MSIGEPKVCACLWGGLGPCPCPHYRAPQPMTVPTFPILPPQPHGCICPPGAEATCKGDFCPRRERKRT